MELGNNPTQDEINASTAGMLQATISVLRALITSHPDQDELLAAIAREADQATALLLQMPIPDRAIHAFETAMGGMGVFPRSAG